MTALGSSSYARSECHCFRRLCCHIRGGRTTLTGSGYGALCRHGALILEPRERVGRFPSTRPFVNQGARPHIVADHAPMRTLAILCQAATPWAGDGTNPSP